MACENLRQELESLQSERAQYSDELHTGGLSGAARAFIVKQISRVNREIASKKNELKTCLFDEGIDQPLTTTFTSTATLTTSHESARGPFRSAITLGLYFAPGRTNVIITQFPSIMTDPFDVPGLGLNVTTVSMLGGTAMGSFNLETGGMNIFLNLKFDHSIEAPILWYEEDSTLPLHLSTGSVGSLQGAPLDRATRGLTLVGLGTFQEGFLGGSTGTVEITGTLADLP